MEFNKKLKDEMNIVFQPIGWRCLLNVKHGTSRILILKTVVNGLCMEKGMPIHSYVGEDPDHRPVMISYLDGKPRVVKDGE
jgi:hypothetical protein